MQVMLRRATTLAAAILAGGVLAAAAGCGSSGGGTSTGAGPSARTLPPAAAGAASSGAGGEAGGGAAAGHPAAAWPTYGRDFGRGGIAVGVAAASGSGALRVGWRASLDGAVYGQPLLVGSLVIAATENDSVYALDASTGRVIWRTHVGTPVPLADLPCGNIDPLGITGTPVYDQGNGLVYAVAETAGYHHVLVGVSVAGGSSLSMAGSRAYLGTTHGVIAVDGV